jgi:hypothetical protein
MKQEEGDWVLAWLLSLIAIAVISGNLGHAYFLQEFWLPPVVIILSTVMLYLLVGRFTNVIWLKIAVIILGMISFLYPVLILHQPILR